MRQKFTTRAQVDAYIAADKIQCLECGKFFATLGPHIKRSHGIGADEYRELWGIPATAPLAGAVYRAMHREKIQRMIATGALTYDHLPDAGKKGANAEKPKIGVARTEHADIVRKLRPGDHSKLPPGAKRADGRDADKERQAQASRRSRKAESE